MDIVLTYIQGIIEVLGLISLVLVFSRVNIKLGRTIAVAMIIAGITLAIRALPIVFGMHLAVSVILIFLFITIMTNSPKSLVFLSVFGSYLCLAAIEFSLNQLFISLDILHIEDVTETSKIWLMMGYIQAVLMNILAVLLQMILKPKYSWKTKVGACDVNNSVILKHRDH